MIAFVLRLFLGHILALLCLPGPSRAGAISLQAGFAGTRPTRPTVKPMPPCKSVCTRQTASSCVPSTMPWSRFATGSSASARNAGSPSARRDWKRYPGPGGAGTARNGRTLEAETLAGHFRHLTPAAMPCSPDGYRGAGVFFFGRTVPQLSLFRSGSQCEGSSADHDAPQSWKTVSRNPVTFAFTCRECSTITAAQAFGASADTGFPRPSGRRYGRTGGVRISAILPTNRPVRGLQ